jgi:hypothetical protein
MVRCRLVFLGPSHLLWRFDVLEGPCSRVWDPTGEQTYFGLDLLDLFGRRNSLVAVHTSAVIARSEGGRRRNIPFRL